MAFLTGARIQYGNLGYFKDGRYGHAIILYREDTEIAVLATWKQGINNIPGEPVMLPGKITWIPKVNMQEVLELKKVVKATKGKPTPYQVDLMRYYQYMHINDILSRPLEESYQVKVIENFKWEEWVDPSKTIPNPHKRADIRPKDYLYRGTQLKDRSNPSQDRLPYWYHEAVTLALGKARKPRREISPWRGRYSLYCFDHPLGGDMAGK